MSNKPSSPTTSTGLPVQQAGLFEGQNIKVLSEFPAPGAAQRHLYKVEIPVAKFVPLESLQGLIFSYDALLDAK